MNAKKEKEYPPQAFANAVKEINPNFPLDSWRTTPEWKMFVRGWNACAESANSAIKAKYNMGEAAERVFSNAAQK